MEKKCWQNYLKAECIKMHGIEQEMNKNGGYVSRGSIFES